MSPLPQCVFCILSLTHARACNTRLPSWMFWGQARLHWATQRSYRETQPSLLILGKGVAAHHPFNRRKNVMLGLGSAMRRKVHPTTPIRTQGISLERGRQIITHRVTLHQTLQQLSKNTTRPPAIVHAPIRVPRLLPSTLLAILIQVWHSSHPTPPIQLKNTRALAHKCTPHSIQQW